MGGLIVQRYLVIAFSFLLVTTASAHAELDEVVLPFVKKHCFDCHSGGEPEGALSLNRLVMKPRNQSEASVWLNMLEQLQADLMPPSSEERPKPAERAAVIQAVEQILQESEYGESYRRKLVMPEYGNWVDHETLFSGKIKTPAYSPSRLWRLSPQIYSANHRNESANPFVFSTRDTGLRDYAATSSVDQSTIETVIMTVNRKLRDDFFRVTGGTRTVPGRNGPRKVTVRPNPRHHYAPFLGNSDPSPEQLERLVKAEFQTVLLRSPTDTEMKRYTNFLSSNINVGGNREAMKATVLAIHLSPESIFRMETGLGPVDKHGRKQLSPEELIYALGYALSDQNPLEEKTLTEAHSSGALKNREGVAATVRKLLDRPDTIQGTGSGLLNYKWANPRILRFFREYFGYASATRVFKDTARRKAEFNQISPSTRMETEAVRDLDNLIHLILERDRNVFEELLTTDKFLVGHPGDNELMKRRHGEFMENLKAGTTGKSRSSKSVTAYAQKLLDRGLVPYESAPKLFAQIHLYSLPVDQGDGEFWSFPVNQPVAIAHRKGVLTHPAWLWAHSTNFDTDPIHRGIWVYTRLLAGVIPDVPPDVDARVPEDPHKTLRERLDVVRQEFCWKCHRKINPLGETFEIFDDWGRYREHFYFDTSGEQNSPPELMVRRDKEFLTKLKAGRMEKRPVDASGVLTGTGNPKLDGNVKNAFELIDRLAKSDRARQSFVRHAFRYFLGRNETLRDSQTLIEADRAYRDSGGSFKALVVSLLTSDSFLYRK